MYDILKITELFKKNNDIVTTAVLKENKVYYADIQQLLSDGIIEKIKRGYYHLINQESHSEIELIKKLFPDAILCMNTALFYYGYIDRTPSEWHIAVDKNSSYRRFNIDYPFVKVYRLAPDILKVGLTKKVIDNVEIDIYDKERLICDCLRYINKMDKENFNKAIQKYINDSEKNISNLIVYSKKLRVQKKVKDLIGVWL